MAQADIRVAEAGRSASSPPAPSGLGVRVSKGGDPRPRPCFTRLRRQTHPRPGVLGVDTASTAGSAALLDGAAGTDQGRYDRVGEVMFVSSCAMLVSRGAWTRIGFPDERFESHHEDLDFCWRARVAGFRVLMTPAAEARHREASLSGERPSEGDHGLGARYERERAALAS